MPAPDRLKRRLQLAFEFGLPDRDALTRSIFAQRAATWRSTLTEEARAAGSPKTGQGPTGRDLAELSRMSREDAASIVQTYFRELGNEIDRMFDRSPNATRTDYIQALTLWADQRAAYKDRQIAVWNRATARAYAQQRFNEKNLVGEALSLFTGPPAREPICAGLFMVGLVDRTFVEAHPTPIHVGCPHDWTVQVTRVGVPLSELWVGE